MADSNTITLSNHAQDLTGQRFGELTVKCLAPPRNSRIAWVCSCDCGGETIATSQLLKRGTKTNCGLCKPRHGSHTSPERRSWSAMIRRCYDEKFVKYPRYGGRGITVCARWKNGENGRSGYECFLIDMGERPSLLYSLDRIDNDGGYSKQNCRWATQTTQQNNKPSNYTVSFNGRTMTLGEWSRELAIRYQTLLNRYHRSWSAGEILGFLPRTSKRGKY